MKLPDSYPAVLPIEREPLPPPSQAEALIRQTRLVDELARRHANHPVSDRLRNVRADLLTRFRSLSNPQQAN